MVLSDLQSTAVVAGAAVVAAGALALGLLATRAATLTLRARIRSARTEPVPTSEVTPGGYVEAVGRIDETVSETIQAPLSGKDCVAYGYRIRQSESNEWQVAEGGGATEFVLSSRSGGSVAVDPGDTSPDTEWELVAETAEGESLPEQHQKAIESHPHLDTDARPEFLADGAAGPRQYYERRIESGEQLHVYGKAGEGGVHRAGIEAADSAQFVLSREAVGSVGGSLFYAVPKLVVGIALLALGAVAGLFALDLTVGVSGIDLASAIATTVTVGGGLTALQTAGFLGQQFGVSLGVGLSAVVGLALLAFGLYLVYRGGDDVWTAARIYLNQPIDPGQVLALDGLVEIEGTAHPPEGAEPIEAVFSGTPCLLCRYRVREQKRKRYRDSDGNRRTKTVWRTIASGAVRNQFAARSHGDRVTVDPTGADLTLGDYETVYTKRGGGKLPQSTRLRLSWGDRFGISAPGYLVSQNASQKRRYQERRLEPGDSLHLYGGTADRQSDGDPLVEKGDEEYFVAVGSELRTVLRRGARGFLVAVFGVVFGAPGAFLLGTALFSVL